MVRSFVIIVVLVTLISNSQAFQVPVFEGSEFKGETSLLSLFKEFKLIQNKEGTLRICTSVELCNAKHLKEFVMDTDAVAKIRKMGKFFKCDISILLNKRASGVAIVPARTEDNITELVTQLIMRMELQGSRNFNYRQTRIQAEHEMDANMYSIIPKKGQQENEESPPNSDAMILSIRLVTSAYLPISKYLADIQPVILTKNPDPEAVYIFVIGNESCDLDSAVSAIGMAFILSKIDVANLSKYISIPEMVDNETVHIAPLLQIDQTDKKLKSETIYFMKKNRLGWDDVTCLEELPADILENAKFVLVDHYKSTHPMIKTDQIVGIFDHHIDGLQKPHLLPNISNDFITIKEVGSSSTVIVALLRKIISQRAIPELTRDDKAVLQLLYGPIILDTNNLNQSSSGTVTRKLDIDMVQYIRHELQLPINYQNKLFDQLQNELINIEGLNGGEILRKDLKITAIEINNEIIRVAVPFIPITPENYINQFKKTLADDMSRFMDLKQCDFVVIMGFQRNSKSPENKGIAIISPRTHTWKSDLQDILLQKLQGMIAGDMTLLTDVFVPAKLANLQVFSQREGKNRKVVLPAVDEALKDFKSTILNHPPAEAA